MRFIILFFVLFISIGCSRKTAPFLVEKTVTHYDTITLISRSTDTIPCDDFKTILVENHDTVYVQVEKKVLTVRKVNRTDTIYLYKYIETARKVKIDNSVKATKGSAVGDGNKITTKKSNWWWIFLAGMLTWFIIQNVLFKVLRTYFPFLKFLP